MVKHGKQRPRRPKAPKGVRALAATVDDFVEAFVQSELMEETSAYLARGRHNRELCDEELNRLWIVAFKSWLAERTHAKRCTADDLWAELRLRGVEPPFDAVRAELAIAMEETKDVPSDPELMKKIQLFRESLDEPKN
jgi:hypothetical protein